MQEKTEAEPRGEVNGSPCGRNSDSACSSCFSHRISYVPWDGGQEAIEWTLPVDIQK